MRLALALVLVLLMFVASPAVAAPAEHGKTWQPVRVHVVCQGWGRTKACPAFLRGFIDETKVLDWASRAVAQVVVFYNVTFRASDDHVNLRFTSKLAGVPSTYEINQVLSTRGTDDEQRGLLRPAFLRGIAPFVGVLHPEAITVSLKAPENGTRAPAPTSPWGYNMWLGGWGNWSRQFKSANGWGGFGVGRTMAMSRLGANLSGSYGLTRQPPLVVDDVEVSLDTDSYSVTTRVGGSRSLDAHWSVGALGRGGHQDPLGRYELTARVHAGASYDWFPSNDPRGNQLAVAYLAGYQWDVYNVTNVLNQNKTHFPTHMLLATGSVRRDKTTFRVRASASAMLIEPRTRYVLALSPSISVQVGDHVDLSLSFGITKQAVPGPRNIDEGNFEEVTRSSYAEPLRIDTSLNINLHWDRSNPDRNNRFDLTGRMSELSTL